MQIPENYYEILGVSQDATSAEITKAFHRLAKQFHPDVNKTAWAEDFFKKINEAYQTLSDPLQRAKYDFSHGYVKVSQTKSNESRQTHTRPQTKSEPQPKTNSNSYAYTNTKSTNSYSYDPSKSKSNQSSSGQQRNTNNTDFAHKYSDRQKSGWRKTYTPPEDYVSPEEQPSGSKALAIFLAILFFLIIYVANISDNSSNSYSSSSYSGSNNYSQSIATNKPTPKPTQTKKPDAIADGLDVTFYNFKHDFNIVYNTKLPGGISNYGSKNYLRTYVNKNSQLFFTKNRNESIHTVILYLSFNANNVDELDNIGMSVVSLVQAAIPDHAFTKDERNNAFDQIIQKGAVYQYGRITISIDAWDQTGKDDKVWIIARKMNEHNQFGVFDLPKSTNGYSIEDLLFNGQSQIYGTEFSGFYLASDGKYYKTTANKTPAAINKKTTPIPLVKKAGGYTEKELISAGYVGKKHYDGTMFYEGFYIAPNGNYYPVGKNIPTLAPTEINYLATEIAENRYKEEYDKWFYYTP